MKHTNEHTDDDMRPEYDFSGGVRGKHAKAYREGHTVTIHQEDGTTIVQEFKLEKNAVVLEPDVKEYFPDSESVNNALRSLIALIPEKSKRLSKPRRHAILHNATVTGSSPTSPGGNGMSGRMIAGIGVKFGKDSNQYGSRHGSLSFSK